MFGDGTDPDDVFKGKIETGWLLSALSMLAAAGGVGDGGVDPQIKRLFVSYVGRDGNETYDTSVGAYAVNIHRNGQWESVIVDDFFPVGHEPGSQQSDNDDDKAKQKAERLRTRGAICAHADGFAELWVPLLEKAVAKYYGGYGEIERGFCHHALEFLTGNEAECMYLAKASRGAGKARCGGACCSTSRTSTSWARARSRPTRPTTGSRTWASCLGRRTRSTTCARSTATSSSSCATRRATTTSGAATGATRRLCGRAGSSTSSA